MTHPNPTVRHQAATMVLKSQTTGILDIAAHLLHIEAHIIEALPELLRKHNASDDLVRDALNLALVLFPDLDPLDFVSRTSVEGRQSLMNDLLPHFPRHQYHITIK